MPTCHDCEDDECVGGSAISPPTVGLHVAGLNLSVKLGGSAISTLLVVASRQSFRLADIALIGTFSSTHVQLFVFISEVTAVLNY